MRIWSISPEYLDTKGLVALWREALLARKVLEGQTKGYINHPQLLRFKRFPEPVNILDAYLKEVYLEAFNRNYKFSQDKLRNLDFPSKIPVNKGQVEYEFEHLLRKLNKRDLDRFAKVKNIKDIKLHKLFEVIDGDVEEWERVE